MEKVTTFNTQTLETILGDLGLPVSFSHLDIGCATVFYHFNLLNPLDFHKVNKIAKCLSTMVHKNVEVRLSSSASFCLGIERESRSFPNFTTYHTALKDKPAGEILLGLDETGKPITKNIRELKSILVAGSSGGGKSVCLTNILCSLICYSKPEEVGIALVDLKRCEFELFKNADHLVCPVQFDYHGAFRMLQDIKKTIDERYKSMQLQGIRKATVDKYPILVVMIDEYAELARNSNKNELDDIVSSIASTGRACNVFIVVATQHAVSTIISNTIKSNLQSRIGLKTKNVAQSNCIINTKDCVNLLGYGDSYMEFDGVPGLHRMQVCYLSDDDINSILEEQNKRALEIKPKTSILRRIKCFLDKLFKNNRNNKFKAIKNEEKSIDELNDLDCIIDE